MASERGAAIVTGAASGIGRAMTLGLLGEGICVVGVDREPVWLGELEEEAADREVAGILHTVLADLSDPTVFGGIISTALRAFGDAPQESAASLGVRRDCCLGAVLLS